MNLSEAFAHYHDLILSSQSPREVTSELGRWKNHIAPLLGGVPLEEIRNLKILQLKKTLESKKLSPQSVYHCLSLVRRILRRAVEWELYEGPVPAFNMPKFDNRRMRFLSNDEAKLLLATLLEKSELWHDISLFALQTGLRAGEIYNLKPFAVHLSQKIIKIYDSKNSITRVIPLNETSVNIVNKYIKLSYDDIPLFHYKGSLPQKSYKIFRNAVIKCKFNNGINDSREKVCFHTLRHTFASWLVQQGTPIAVVSHLLGHKNIKMTMRYAHLCPTQEIQAVSNLPLSNMLIYK